jgi:hypothetical protein
MCPALTKEELDSLVRKEDELRLSASWQKRFAEQDSNAWWAEQCHLLQQQAISQVFPYFDDKKRSQAMVALRCSRKRFNNDAEFYKPVYVRHDRTMQDGTPITGPSIGDAVVDIAALHHIGSSQGMSSTFKQYLGHLPKPNGNLAMPLVIFAGSLT